ncbi:unnamed protein product [Rotaria sp. Silwood1]|nr:unnamed protein product [Rotaria sp. Silwood1]CAF0763906.1 unnamed protein product [Rotaria sp. Silwood1]CAF3319320.1 unnamed protein product [Rotaria sp. Silwood1]CAF3346488.1 unnamed protein product [Rotaria sp. Silwood1]CAF4551695.1 unnamed protein product [Rotaria sp. Silwood1]
MVIETRQSRTRLLHYEYHHHNRNRRRHHTLDNATLDKFNFICVQLHPDESRTDSSSSHTNLTMTQPKNSSISTTSMVIPPATISTVTTAARRVRFKFDENDKNQNDIDLNDNRHTRSSDDVRLSEKNSIHRVEFEIPIHRDINPWLNVDCSTQSSLPAKTRSLTTQKIDIKHTNNNSIRVQNIAPFIEAEISSEIPITNDSDKTQSQWYRQMYGHLHKPLEMKQEHQQNPYTPTYTFPDEFSGDVDLMEDYIRKKASQTLDKNDEKNSSSTLRISSSNQNDQRTISKRTNDHKEKVIRFEDHYSSPVSSSSSEQFKLNNDAPTTNFINTNLRSNSNDIPTSDNEQKSIYKRISRGGDMSSNGLQKFSNINRGRHRNYLLSESKKKRTYIWIRTKLNCIVQA